MHRNETEHKHYKRHATVTVVTTRRNLILYSVDTATGACKYVMCTIAHNTPCMYRRMECGPVVKRHADMPCVMYLKESFGGHVELALLARQLCLQLGGVAGELQLLLRPLPLQTA